jgi:hypothetical protein
MLMYYKTGVAELKFKEDGSGLMYKMKADEEVNEIVDSIIKSSGEPRAENVEPPPGEDST